MTSINEIFYQKGGRAQTFMSQDENTVTTNPNCVQVYQTNYSWDSRLFQLDGFYSTGYYYCNYEDNFFGFYPEAHYEPNVEICNGFAPNGFEVEGKRKSNRPKVVVGSALWWGFNHAILLKYNKHFARFNFIKISKNLSDDAELKLNKTPFFLLSLAAGDNLSGSASSETIFPQALRVDFIRL